MEVKQRNIIAKLLSAFSSSKGVSADVLLIGDVGSLLSGSELFNEEIVLLLLVKAVVVCL